MTVAVEFPESIRTVAVDVVSKEEEEDTCTKYSDIGAEPDEAYLA